MFRQGAIAPSSPPLALPLPACTSALEGQKPYPVMQITLLVVVLGGGAKPYLKLVPEENRT